MTDTSTISDTVMRRVRSIHLLRTTARPVFAALVFLLALWEMGREVWVAKVFENMPSLADAPAVITFYFNAYLSTDMSVQALLLVAVAALIWFAREIAIRSVPRLVSI